MGYFSAEFGGEVKNLSDSQGIKRLVFISLEQCLKKTFGLFFKNAKGFICLHYGNSHGIHLFLFESRHEHHPAVSF